MFLQNIVNHKLLDIIVHQVTSLIEGTDVVDYDKTNEKNKAIANAFPATNEAYFSFWESFNIFSLVFLIFNFTIIVRTSVKKCFSKFNPDLQDLTYRRITSFRSLLKFEFGCIVESVENQKAFYQKTMKLYTKQIVI